MPTYRTLSAISRCEPPRIKKSRFFGVAAPVATEAEAIAVVEEARRADPDANHHCFAWRLLDGSSRVSDDGEPGGTAGAPILTRIDGADLRGVVVVVTRYFGGTKLGKGGLIRAYGGTAAETLALAPVLEVRETAEVRIVHAYSEQSHVQAVLHGLQLVPCGQAFGQEVELTLAVPVELVSELESALRERTAGRVGLC